MKVVLPLPPYEDLVSYVVHLMQFNFGFQETYESHLIRVQEEL